MTEIKVIQLTVQRILPFGLISVVYKDGGKKLFPLASRTAPSNKLEQPFESE